MSAPGRPFGRLNLCLDDIIMAQDNIANYRVGPTVPSRPSKLTIVMLAAVVVGFFTLIFTQGEATLQAEKKGSAPSTASTQPAGE